MSIHCRMAHGEKKMATHNILYWDQKLFQKSVLHCSSTNTPVFYKAHLLQAYQAFASTFDALEAPYFRQEHVLQYPGQRPIATEGPFNPMDLLSPEEFIAEENLLLNKQQKSVNEGVTEDDETIQTANYLLRLPTTSLIQALLAAAPSPLTPLLLLRKTRNSSLPPPTIRPS
jgi:hypothetical protein